MTQINVNDKINNKILSIEAKTGKTINERERKLATEMFMSGFLFAVQYFNEKGGDLSGYSNDG